MISNLQELQNRIQTVLDEALSNIDIPPRLLEAMRYSTLAGGKRARAMLVYAAGQAMNTPLTRLDRVAAALECIHCYSLIHDDLPSMDDDALRRGQPTNHIKFDEATAILAGDALQALAFELVSQDDSGLNDRQCRQITKQLSIAAGGIGMVGGQSLDIDASSLDQKADNQSKGDQSAPAKTFSLEQLENVHQRKTGALIKAAVLCGALASDELSGKQHAAFEQYGNNIGLAFQVIDDVLDIESSTEQLGKTSGADIAQGKMTYPAVIGLTESKKLAEKLYQQSIASLSMISDNTQLLEDLAELIVRRKN